MFEHVRSIAAGVGMLALSVLFATPAQAQKRMLISRSLEWSKITCYVATGAPKFLGCELETTYSLANGGREFTLVWQKSPDFGFALKIVPPDNVSWNFADNRSAQATFQFYGGNCGKWTIWGKTFSPSVYVVLLPYEEKKPRKFVQCYKRARNFQLKLPQGIDWGKTWWSLKGSGSEIKELNRIYRDVRNNFDYYFLKKFGPDDTPETHGDDFPSQVGSSNA